MVSNPNPLRLIAVVGHPFSYDASQGGTTFSDPDGDPLIYSVTISAGPSLGLSVSGTVISGTPIQPGQLRSMEIFVEVSDQRGGFAGERFVIDVNDNSAPGLRRPNADVVTTPGSAVDRDVTQGGTTFVDVDGDPVNYQVSLLTPARGLMVAGTRITGVIDSVGVVLVKITASDQLGASNEDTFFVAAAAPALASPTLPATSYTYDDTQLPLPLKFRNSREFFAPLWDTTFLDNKRVTDAGATLGRVLFYDKRLSVTNTVACASCHQQAHGFATPERFNVGVLGEPLTRNAMALANVRYNLLDQYFSDMRVTVLENLVPLPIQELRELGSPLELLVDELAATAFYPPLFQAAFGTPEVTSDRIALALVHFLRSLLSYRTKFDRAYHVMNEGDVIDPATVLTAQELRGAEVFVEGRCDRCHNNDAHTMDGSQNNGLDAVFTDPGAGRGRFRAASLRNIVVTAPYMHDGRFATLREVIEHYDHGVQASDDLSPVLVEGGAFHMNLSEEDKQALEAFLNTFTDQEFLEDPKFSDPFQ